MVRKPNLPLVIPGHPLAHGLVAAWLFYEGSGTVTRDVRGRHHGTISGFAWNRNAGYGPAVDCDGSGESLVADHDDLDPAEITIVARVYPTGNASNPQIIDKGLNSGWRCRMNTNNTLNMLDRGSLNAISTTQTIPDNAWSIVGFNFAKTQLSIFIDGIRWQLAGSPYGAPTTSSDLRLGGTSGTDSDWLGYIDFIYMYNRALTPREHYSLFRDPYQAFTPAQDIYYHLTGAAPGQEYQPRQGAAIATGITII